jgi:rod shape-determining protein MreC
MFSSLSRRRVLLLVVLTCVLLITLDKRGNPVIDSMRSGFARVMSPFDTATKAVVLPLERAWHGVTGYDDLLRQNQALQDQLEHIKGNDIEARSAVLEYRELLKINQLTSKFQYKTVVAQVVGESPSNFQNTVEINVGTRQGLAVGMPVTDGAGLIGRITKVSPSTAVVLLLTDPEFAISAQVLTIPGNDLSATPSTEPNSGTDGSTPSESTAATTTTIATQGTTVSGIPVFDPKATTTTPPSTTDPFNNIPGFETLPTAPPPPTLAPQFTTTTLLEVVRETGTLEGQGADKPLNLRFIDVTSSLSTVKVGAVVDTAGGNNGLAPQGIPIGVITRISRQTSSGTATVEVTPNASLKRLNFIAVVLYVPNQDAIGR